MMLARGDNDSVNAMQKKGHVCMQLDGYLDIPADLTVERDAIPEDGGCKQRKRLELVLSD